jgi:hypothetical protein
MANRSIQCGPLGYDSDGSLLLSKRFQASISAKRMDLCINKFVDQLFDSADVAQVCDSPVTLDELRPVR